MTTRWTVDRTIVNMIPFYQTNKSFAFTPNGATLCINLCSGYSKSLPTTHRAGNRFVSLIPITSSNQLGPITLFLVTMIAEFYENLEIFITGGSGVVGKSVIEKLFRSCNVKKIYMLLRTKKGESPEERIEKVKKSRIFRVLLEQKPNELDKLEVIPGDTGDDGLGISDEHREKLKNVSVFFHSAATTRFDEPLRQAIRFNLKSTMECLKLAETFKNLRIFIHVSTFFSNPYLKYIEDKVYPAVFDWRVALDLLDDSRFSDDEINAITDKLISGFPNTYLFTKHLAEKLVDDYRHKLPVCIFRPSIVIAALKEPEPGFTETTTGVMGMVTVWGLGLMQIMHCRRDIQLDVTPVDYGTIVLLISTALSAQLPRESFEEATPVTKFSSRGYIPFTLGEQAQFLQKGIETYPFSKSIFLPNFVMTSCSFLTFVVTIVLQVIPSFFMDCLLRLFGYEPFLIKIQRKIIIMSQVLHFFVSNEYDSNGVSRIDEFIELERGTEFCLQSLLTVCGSAENASKCIGLMAYGCRKYLLNDDDSTLARSRRIHKCKKIAYAVLRGYVLYAVGKYVYRRAMEYVSDFQAEQIYSN